jgi:hypothetical protein
MTMKLTMKLTMSEQSSTETSTERGRGQSLANPRRLRIGRDGRPLPMPGTDDD